MSAEAREETEDQGPDPMNTDVEDTRNLNTRCNIVIVVQDLLEEDTDQDPRMIADPETSKKEDASDVERKVTLRGIVLKAEEDQGLHSTEIREETPGEEARATHQLVAEVASMTREEEVAAEV